jgi:hypothetical protein
LKTGSKASSVLDSGSGSALVNSRTGSKLVRVLVRKVVPPYLALN